MKEVLVERSWSDIILPANLAAKLVEIVSQGITVESANARRDSVPYSKYGESCSAPYRGGTPKLSIGPLPENLCETREMAQGEAEARLEKRVEERMKDFLESEEQKLRERAEAEERFVEGDPFNDEAPTFHPSTLG